MSRTDRGGTTCSEVVVRVVLDDGLLDGDSVDAYGFVQVPKMRRRADDDGERLLLTRRCAAGWSSTTERWPRRAIAAAASRAVVLRMGEPATKLQSPAPLRTPNPSTWNLAGAEVRAVCLHASHKTQQPPELGVLGLTTCGTDRP